MNLEDLRPCFRVSARTVANRALELLQFGFFLFWEAFLTAATHINAAAL